MFVMLGVIILIVILLIFFMLSVIILIFIMLGVVMLSVKLCRSYEFRNAGCHYAKSVSMPSTSCFNAFKFSVALLSVAMQSAIVANVTSYPLIRLAKWQVDKMAS
jgi:hypothetical protein